MDNLYDYIEWMGGFSFSEYAFNELDALVLSLLSYYDLSPNAATELKPSDFFLRDCAVYAKAGKLPIRITGTDMGYQAVLEAATASRRFGVLNVTNTVDMFDPSVPLQFAAMTFRCPEFNFIALRGTDSSLAGWKEDFMISFTKTAAQELAAVYCEQHLEDGKPNYIGGHSKGGNLALYAACMLSDSALEDLTRVYLLDGPGLCPEVLDPALIERIDSKATRIIPEFDIVGKLFEPKISDTRIVKSSASGVMQHSIGTWGVDHGKLFLAEANDPRSLEINAILDRWISSMNQSQRILLTNELFEVLGANGAITLEDLEKEGAQGLQSILTGFHDISDVTKRSLADLRTRAVLGEHYDKWLELKEKQEDVKQAAAKMLKEGLQKARNQHPGS